MVASRGRGRPGSLLFLLGSAAGAPRKAPPRDAPGGEGGRGGGPRSGRAPQEEKPRAAVAWATVPRVCWVTPPVSPLPPPGSSPWWLHQEPVPALVVGGDVDVFSARLLGGEAPSVDVVGAFLLLVRVGSFLLQLLPFVFRPPVLEPDFHLGERERRALTGGSRRSRPQLGTVLQPGSKLSFPWRPAKKSLSPTECSHGRPALPQFPLSKVGQTQLCCTSWPW